MALYHASNDAFPTGIDMLVDQQYILARKLKCPSVEAPSKCDYLYQPPAVRFGDELADIRGTIMACDRKGNHKAGRRVAYADTHVEWLTEEEFQAALAKPINAAFAAALKQAEGQ